MDHKPWNPIHAIAVGIGAGFVLFAVKLIRAEVWQKWPNPQLIDESLGVMMLLAISFGLIAVVRNWRVRSRSADL